MLIQASQRPSDLSLMFPSPLPRLDTGDLLVPLTTAGKLRAAFEKWRETRGFAYLRLLGNRCSIRLSYGARLGRGSTSEAGGLVSGGRGPEGWATGWRSSGNRI